MIVGAPGEPRRDIAKAVANQVLLTIGQTMDHESTAVLIDPQPGQAITRIRPRRLQLDGGVGARQPLRRTGVTAVAQMDLPHCAGMDRSDVGDLLTVRTQGRLSIGAWLEAQSCAGAHLQGRGCLLDRPGATIH